MPRPNLFFSPIEETREGYFVRYSPPVADHKFAIVSLNFRSPVDSLKAAELMENEAQSWTDRYPVPVMVFAHDEQGDRIRVSSDWKKNNLIAWKRPDGSMEARWELVKDDEIPGDALSDDELLELYGDFEYRTADDIDREVFRNARATRIARHLIFGWAVIVPAAIAILGWAHPVFGALVLGYALFKAGREGGLMLGWIRPTERRQSERDKQTRMEHYYYHCERNPEGFRRLRSENWKQDRRERVQTKARDLAGS